MPIYYSVAERGDPTKPEAPKKFYATAKSLKRTDLDEISKDIARGSTTVSEADVRAVLVELADQISERIVGGETVHLGNLGYFRATLKSKGADTEKEVTSASIEDVRVRFSPGKDLEARLNSAEFKKAAE